MIKLTKVILLQAFWYLAVYTNFQYQPILLISATVFAFINYLLIKKTKTFSHYLFTLILFVGYGLAQESLFIKLNLVSYDSSNFPWFLISLYIVFIGYYGDLFNHFASKPKWLLSALGALGGCASYYGGSKIAPMTILTPNYYPALAVGWGLFFPMSFKIFYEGFMWNKLLDVSIFWSFDLSGFLRHQKEFTEEIEIPDSKNIFITGGTSGIGNSVALSFLTKINQVHYSGRSKAAENLKQENAHFHQWDTADWEKISDLVEKLPQLDYLVLNAGGMPSDFSTNKQGIEYQFASQLFGHYYFSQALKNANKFNQGARIVWVTSGGMYLRKLDLKELTNCQNYDKVGTYANVKRAQVNLLTYFKQQFPEQIVTAMHPGWAATPGVQQAIPKFDQFMQGRLRNAEQAADTILWLLLTKEKVESGELYFDRQQVNKNYFWFTKGTKKIENDLINLLEDKNPN